MKNGTQGFTLIELLIVIAIIGILAAVLIPNLLGARKRAYDTAAQSCAKAFQTVEATWQIDNRTYADMGTGTTKINNATDGMSAGCKEATAKYAKVTAADGTTYSYTFWDTRGQNAFNVTPEAMTTVAVPGTATAIPSN